MNTREDITVLAGEYVIGTLDEAERASVAARRLREPDLDSAISRWEDQLAPLNLDTGEISPNDGLFESILARIENAPQTGATSAGEVVQLRASLARWRAMAIATGAVAAALLVAILAYRPWLQPDAQTYVAVFQQNDKQPAFILSVDLETREVVIRPVTATQPADKAYQLWIVAEELGDGPQSLGLLNASGQPTRKKLDLIGAQGLRKALFGISVEPPGGSPTGKPTGPAIHGRLIPTKK